MPMVPWWKAPGNRRRAVARGLGPSRPRLATAVPYPLRESDPVDARHRDHQTDHRDLDQQPEWTNSVSRINVPKLRVATLAIAT